MLDQTVGSYGVLEAEDNRELFDLELEELSRNGYTIIDSGLDDATISALGTKVIDAYEQQAAALGDGALETSSDAQVARCLLVYDSSFLALATSSALWKFCTKLFGSSFTLLQQNGLINRPTQEHFQGNWHRDLPYQHWVASKPVAIAALFCIDEFDPTTGGTYALPGSHCHERFPSDGYVRRHQTVMSARPGAFIVMNAMMFHRAGRNISTRVRRGVNHLIGLPFMAQQIDIPQMLAGEYRDDTTLSGYLGYKWGPAPSVEAWRRARHIGA